MKNDEPDQLDAELRELFAADEREMARHPSTEELAAYARGELSASATESLMEHLGPCQSCTATVLAVQFPETDAAAADRPAASEVAAEIEAIVARTRSSDSSQPLPGRRLSAPARGWRALAAALAVACLGLAFLVAKLQRDVGYLEGALLTVRASPRVPAPSPQTIGPPQTGVPIVDLYPSSVARGEESVATVIDMPGDAGLVTLILTPPSGLSHDAYALRISGADGIELWRGATRSNAAGAFVVVLSRRFLAAGPERIDLYAIDGEEEQLVEEYPVHFSGL